MAFIRSVEILKEINTVFEPGDFNYGLMESSAKSTSTSCNRSSTSTARSLWWPLMAMGVLPILMILGK